jgi:FkbM family methyltransferase
MKKILALSNLYKENKIDKAEFISEIYKQYHSILFDYAEYIRDTNINRIEIEGGRVIMKTRDKGIRIECSPGDHRIAPIETLNFHDYERGESIMMEKLMSNSKIFFDIGANIGWYSINMGVIKRDIKVYAFEPIKKTYDMLCKNIRLNSMMNINTYNFGFSDKKGTFPFYYYPEGSGNASSANLTGRNDVEIFTCKLDTLDEFITLENLKVDFIKCDVEGAELLVFKGGIKTIRSNKPIVFSEILRKWTSKFNYNPNEIFKLFEEEGYESYTTDGEYLYKFSRMHEDTIQTNFFFLHTEVHKELISRWAK